MSTWLRNEHVRAGRKLPTLAEKQGHKCYWCSQRFVIARTLPRVIKAGRFFVSWIAGVGEQSRYRYCRIATVDHIIPLSEGGDNEKGNLVAACGQCNHKRNRKAMHLASAERKRVNGICQKCGKVKEIRKYRKCNKCRLGHKLDRVIMRGEFNNRCEK